MKKLLIFLCVTLFLINVTQAQPPFEESSNTFGLQIFHQNYDILKLHQNFTLHVHVSNISNGYPVNNSQVSCYLHIYNSSGQHVFQNNEGLERSLNGWDFEQHIDSGNFSDIGPHIYYIWCNDSLYGGSSQSSFYVTPSGKISISFGDSIIPVFSLLTIFLTAGFFYLFSVRLVSSAGKISFIVLSSILMLSAIFYSMVLVQEYAGLFTNSVSGFETFFYVSIIMAGIAFIAFMIFAILVSIRVYKFKRGWLD